MAISEAPAESRVRAFLIADVRGYTSYTVEHGDDAAAELAASFAEVMTTIAGANGGELVELRGDEALVSFASTRQALRAAIAAQDEFGALARTNPRRAMRVGIGLDAGEAVAVLGGYRGKALNLAARLCSLAGAGEVLASEALVHLAGSIEEVAYEERGQVQLKGFAEPVPIVEVRAASEARAGARGLLPEPAGDRLPIGAFLGALPSTPLAAREEEVANMRRPLESAAAGEGRTLLLAGEPGAGKTRLVQELFLLARNAGFRLGVGSCLETRRGVPYYPFLDALPALAVAAGPLLELDPYDRWPQLRQLGGGAEPGGSGGAAEEERLRREVAAFVAAVARIRPVALFVDDLHWADDSSLQLLHHLARHTRDAPVLLVGTYRDVEVGRQHPLEGTLRELRRDELATTVAVRRLAEPGTAALVAASFGEESVSEEFAELVHRQTEGNPFFIQQVLRALVERGDVYRENGRWERREVAEIELPESIRSTIGERVSRLPEATQEVLASASVLGQPFRFADLVALAGQGEDALDANLAPAVESALVRSPDGETYSFDHALTQQTLLAEVPPRRRRRLHAEAAAVLAARPDAQSLAAQIADHLVQGDQPAEAGRWSLAAGQQALGVYAHSEAEKHYRMAAELAEEVGDRKLQAEAESGLGAALRALGRLAEAQATLLTAAAALRVSGPPESEAECLVRLATACRELATPAVAIVPMEEFLARNPGLVERPLAAILATLARLYWQAGRHDEASPMADRAAELAIQAGAVDIRLSADITRANKLSDRGRVDEARDLLVQAVADSETAGDLNDRSNLNNNLAFLLWSLGDFSQNLVYRTRSMELAELLPQSDGHGFSLTMVGQAYASLGELDRAEELLAQASRLFEGSARGGRGFAYSQVQWASTHLQRGRLEEARRVLVGVEDWGREVESGDLQLSLWAGTAWCELQSRSGRAAEAVELMAPRVERSRAQNFRVAWGETALALAQLCAGRLDEAEALATSAADRSRREKELAVLLDAARVQGMVRTVRGDWAGADAAFGESREICLRAPYPWGAAWTRLEWARSLAARGEAARAAELEAEARAGFAAIGCEPAGLPVATSGWPG